MEGSQQNGRHPASLVRGAGSGAITPALAEAGGVEQSAAGLAVEEAADGDLPVGVDGDGLERSPAKGRDQEMIEEAKALLGRPAKRAAVALRIGEAADDGALVVEGEGFAAVNVKGAEVSDAVFIPEAGVFFARGGERPAGRAAVGREGPGRPARTVEAGEGRVAAGLQAPRP